MDRPAGCYKNILLHNHVDQETTVNHTQSVKLIITTLCSCLLTSSSTCTVYSGLSNTGSLSSISTMLTTTSVELCLPGESGVTYCKKRSFSNYTSMSEKRVTKFFMHKHAFSF